MLALHRSLSGAAAAKGLAGWATVAMQALSTATDLKAVLAEKIPEQQVSSPSHQIKTTDI
jgi:hypothetical protein